MKRFTDKKITESILNNQIVLVSGPKSVGVSEKIHSILHKENIDFKSIIATPKIKDWEVSDIKKATKKKECLVIEEAQFLLNLQSIIDGLLSKKNTPTIILISSYRLMLEEELMAAIQQSELQQFIFAPTFYELASHFGLPNEQKEIENRLIYGTYPQVLEAENKSEVLIELIQEIIHHRFGAIDRANDSEKLIRVLQLIAFHIGEPISYNEIAIRADLDNETVERYIDLLCNAFILINLPSYHTEQRYELKKSNMIYFYDNGIRNAIIQNFNPTFLRNDHLQLWKNYVISERIKWTKMNGQNKEFYFWKTHTKQIVDLLEIDYQRSFGYKIDWEKRKKIKFPQLFEKYYPDFKLKTLNKTTYYSILTNKK